MQNLSALAPVTTAATALSNLVLVSPNANIGYQPQNLPGEEGKPQPDAFLFHYEGEQSLSSETDIPDHYLEDNKNYQDQIALKPVTYTTRGFIGELNDVTPGFLEPAKIIANKLTGISGYTPQLTVTGLLAYQQAFFLYQVASNAANSAVAAWSSLAGVGSDTSGDVFASGPVQNKQQVAYQKLFGYQQERRLFTVQTPWAVFRNMAIFKLRAIQDDVTKTLSDFEVVWKQLRFASTDASGGYLDSSLSKFQGHAAQQASPLVNLGTSTPVPGPSLASGLSTIA